MKETIEAYVVIRDKMRFIFLDKVNAETEAQIGGGTVVKLTGEMPRKPIERKTVAWVELREPIENCAVPFGKLGIGDAWCHKTERCQTKVEIIVRELSDE